MVMRPTQHPSPQRDPPSRGTPPCAGVPGRIHVSNATRSLLPHEPWEPTGGVQVKGKVGCGLGRGPGLWGGYGQGYGYTLIGS